MTAKESDQFDLAVLNEDIASLRRDVTTLMDHLKNGGVGYAQGVAKDTLEKIGDEVQSIYRMVSAECEHSAKAVSRRVEERPLTSILIAFGVGLVSAKLLSR